jgi:hypothetical protein
MNKKIVYQNKNLFSGHYLEELIQKTPEWKEYEKRQQKMPNDVSKEFRGYDIKSAGMHETRYIEVKAFAESGVVEMTENEWIMATKLKENYWLYVVEHVVQPEKRRLNLIQNPSEKFKKYEIMSIQIRIKIKNWQDLVDSMVAHFRLGKSESVAGAISKSFDLLGKDAEALVSPYGSSTFITQGATEENLFYTK